MTEARRSGRLLLDEHPLIVLKELAVLIGLNEAIVLQQLNYWLHKNRHKKDHQRDGRVWSWNTTEEWRLNDFPFWSTRTIERVFDRLEHELDLVDTCQPRGSDRTKWFTINYDNVDALTRSTRQVVGMGGDHAQPDKLSEWAVQHDNLSDSRRQVVGMEHDNLSDSKEQRLPTETSHREFRHNGRVDDASHEFDSVIR